MIEGVDRRDDSKELERFYIYRVSTDRGWGRSFLQRYEAEKQFRRELNCHLNIENKRRVFMYRYTCLSTKEECIDTIQLTGKKVEKEEE